MDTAIILEGNKSSTCKMATPASSSHLRSDENEQPMSQPLCDVQMSLPSSPSQAHGERNEAGMVIHAMSEPSGTLGAEPRLVFDINGIMVTSQCDGRHAQSNSQHALPLPSMSGFVEPHCSLLATSPHSSLQACGNLMEDDKVTQALSEAIDDRCQMCEPRGSHGEEPQQIFSCNGIKAPSYGDDTHAQSNPPSESYFESL